MQTPIFTKKSLLLADIDQTVTGFGGRLFVTMLLLCAIFVAMLIDLRFGKIFAFPLDVADASKEDMMAFWRGAVMALNGHAAALYEPISFRTDLPENGAGLLWLNPPHFLLLITPLGLLPYGVAKAIWLTLSLIALGAIARIAGRGHPLAWLIFLSPAAFAHLLVIQAGPFVAIALLGALLLSRDHPVPAGVLLALLTVKPQFGILIPVFLIATSQWRTITAAAFGTILMIVGSVIVFGPGPWAAFFEAVNNGFSGHAARLHIDMLNVHQTVGKLGIGESSRSTLQLLVIAAGGAIVWVSARRLPRDLSIGITLLVSAAASPSLWVYDWPLITAGLFMLARNRGPWALWLQCAAGALWISPLISLGVGTYASSLLAPFILIVVIGGFVWHLRENGYYDSADTSCSAIS